MTKSVFALIVMFCFSGASQASDFYGELSANYMMIDALTAKPAPIGAELRLGMYLEQGVGLELFAGSGAASDEDLDIDVDLSYTAGGALRFESPEKDGGKVYFLLGYAVTELDLNRSDTGLPGKEAYDGFSYGGGVEFRMAKSRDVFLGLRVQRYFSGDEVDIDVASLGLRLGF